MNYKHRLAILRANTRESVHAQARILLPEEWETKTLSVSLAERKAEAIKKILDHMPLYIGEQELIVGTRTVYGSTPETGQNMSCFDYVALPPYVSEEDVTYFGFNHENVTKAHYAPDFSIVLECGIDGILQRTRKFMETYTLQDQKEFGNTVLIVYTGLKNLITHYSDYAQQLAEAEKEEKRKEELREIGIICKHIASKPAGNLREACQLFWFLYMATIIENFQFVNYGRIDQTLAPYIQGETDDELTEIMGCLMLKMYDQYNLILADKSLMGKFSAQHNITIGGVKRDGSDGCNRITKAILAALRETRLPDPLVSVRVNSNAPDWLLLMSARLSVEGMNCIAFYNDDLVVDSLHHAGLTIEDARDYGFGLCQDILIPGRGDHYCSAGVNLSVKLLDTLEQIETEPADYQEFFNIYMENVLGELRKNLQRYNDWEYAILEYNKGNRDVFFDYVKSGRINVDEPFPGIGSAQAATNNSDDSKKELYIQTLMSPLPFTSSLYHGCLESGVDVTRCGCINRDRGVMILGPVVAFNSLAALKKVVFEERRYTLAEVKAALKANWNGYEKMRQYLWNAPKWGNNEDYVDRDAVRIVEMACQVIGEYKTPGGGNHLSGVHQPHPVFAGRTLPATPEGRFAGTPIPVTLSPENGTLKKSAAEAMKSVSKLNSRWLQWNSCLMLQYYSSTFGEADGPEKFAGLIKAYHKLGGIQHQPNVVDISQLKDAQVHPENYKDLTIRMWGVSAHFVDLPRDIQDEFISRYEN